MLTHLALIMDGNGRWAEAHHMPLAEGHRRGAEAARKVIEACPDLGIRYLTLYTFSSENWQRPKDEVSHLMSLLRFYMQKELASLHKNGVRIRVIGDRSLLDADIQTMIATAETTTQHNDRLHLTLALSYGSRQELISATQHIAQKISDGSLRADAIDDTVIQTALYTHDLPDPDLLVRTGGTHRLSNFLLWQCAYTELYFTDILWPDFDKAALKECCEDFLTRERRFGTRPNAQSAAS